MRLLAGPCSTMILYYMLSKNNEYKIPINSVCVCVCACVCVCVCTHIDNRGTGLEEMPLCYNTFS